MHKISTVLVFAWRHQSKWVHVYTELFPSQRMTMKPTWQANRAGRSALWALFTDSNGQEMVWKEECQPVWVQNITKFSSASSSNFLKLLPCSLLDEDEMSGSENFSKANAVLEAVMANKPHATQTSDSGFLKNGSWIKTGLQRATLDLNLPVTIWCRIFL